MTEGTQPPPPPENPYGSGAGQPPPGGAHPAPQPGQPPPYQPPAYPPPAGGYGGGAPPPMPPTGADGYDAVEAIKYGWSKFTQNAAPFLLGALLVGLISILFSYLGQLVSESVFDTGTTTTIDPDTGVSTTERAGLLTGLLANGLVSFVGQVVTTLASAGLLKMAFDAVSGRPVSLGTMLQGWDKLQVVIATLLVGVATFIGILLCVLPGIAVAVLTAFTTAMVVDQKRNAVDAIKASFDLVRRHPGQTLLWMLLAFLCGLLGAIACGVGLLVAVPVILISQAYTVRTLTGGQVAPAYPTGP